MFAGCRGLTGEIENLELPDTLIDAKYMFDLCTGLSGNPPAFPSSMNYNTCGNVLDKCYGTFYRTHITNDGSWPSGAW